MTKIRARICKNDQYFVVQIKRMYCRRLWATPSDIASMSAQPYKPKSPPTISYKEEKKAKQQKKLTVLGTGDH